jgi:hypothetical protein
MAKVIKEFLGCKDGEAHPTQFVEGMTVEGDLARVAVSEGWAELEEGESLDPPGKTEPAEGEALEAPSKKARKSAPENK